MTIKIKLRRIIAILGVVVLGVAGYVGWQLYSGQQMANQYAADAQRLAQGVSNGTASSNSQAFITQNVSTPDPQTSGSQPNSGTPSSPSGTPSFGDYKQLMSSPYQQTLQTMQTVKGNTLALQEKKMSLSAYKASIINSQATFTSSEAFVRANPPTEEKFNAAYQELLAGISLAKEAMGVVLNGISSLNPSSLYAAREMGLRAQQQVVDGYSHL